MARPLVSVIIPTHNEARVISTNLQAIKNQPYRRCEIIVVDDGSADETVRLARQFTPLVFSRPHFERSVQRNFGASRAHGKYLLFLDADMELTPGVIGECVAHMERDLKLGALAISEEPIAANFWEKAKAFERSFYSEKGDPDIDAARFFSRRAFQKAGGYDETLIGPEDWDLPETIRSLGFRIGRVSSRILHYERIPSLFRLARKKYYYALTSPRYFAKHRLSILGPKTVYLLRPVFYRNWKKMLAHPGLTLGMIIILTTEQLFGAVGYLIGKVRPS